MLLNKCITSPAALLSVQLRCFSHPMWNKKTRRFFKPTYFDDVNYNKERRWDAKQKDWRYNSQDPLFFDYDKIYINGGIMSFVDKIKGGGKSDMSLPKRAYVLYHMAK